MNAKQGKYVVRKVKEVHTHYEIYKNEYDARVRRVEATFGHELVLTEMEDVRPLTEVEALLYVSKVERNEED